MKTYYVRKKTIPTSRRKITQIRAFDDEWEMIKTFYHLIRMADMHQTCETAVRAMELKFIGKKIEVSQSGVTPQYGKKE